MTLPPFEQMVRRDGPVVWRVCRALLDEADAEDAWAETFLAALRAYPTLRPGSDPRPWLVTIAHRKAIDVLRATARRPHPRADLPDTASARPGPADSAGGEPVWAAVAQLPPKQRGAVVYRHVAGLGYDEIGELLGCSPAAARRNVADGLARLRHHPALRHPDGQDPGPCVAAVDPAATAPPRRTP